jgi:acyl-[acyl-carrier-protein] desaturase
LPQTLLRDPEGALLAFADMMRKGIVMPAHFVDDGVHAVANSGAGARGASPANLFTDYATVADNIGVYTTSDYASIVDHLVGSFA